MKIPEPVVSVIFVMIVGKACGFSEERIMNVLYLLFGTGIILKFNLHIKGYKKVKELIVKFFTKN